MLPLEQISAIASTIMSTVLATVALIFTYRQNLGWNPVALVTGTSISGLGGTWENTFHIKIEFWNRRKYPVNIRSIHLDIVGLEVLDSKDGMTSFDYHVRKNKLFKKIDESIEASKFYQVELSVHSDYQSLDAVRPEFSIRIEYFDPVRNKNLSSHVYHRFFFPGLGWEKTDEQRRVIEKLFIEMKAEDEAKKSAGKEAS